MAYRDLREFLNRLEAEGELTRVRAEVDLKYEIGAICRKVLDQRGPALFFENPSSTIPLVANIVATRRRYAMALETTPEELHREWTERTGKPLPPVTVKDGPCKERIYKGGDVDLFRFPIPVWNGLDGGPYITFPCHISKDPDTGIRNAAMYRAQVHNRNTIGILGAPYRHIMQHARKQSGPLPVAIALGCDPAIHIASVASFPFGTDELAMAGALRKEPVEVVPCETIPLEAPARAEIVLEGEIFLNEKQMEGYFGEFTGYYGLRIERPVIKIKAITHRNNPYYLASYEGKPPQETNYLMGIPTEAEIHRLVSIPGIKKVHVTDGGCGAFNCIVSIEKKFEGYGKMMAMAVMGTWGARFIKNLIIVDEDIDPFNWNDVEWALATRVQPDRDVEIIKAVTGVILDPSLSEHERATGHSRTSKMIIDATKYDADRFEIACLPKKDVLDRVMKEWEKYGIPDRRR